MIKSSLTASMRVAALALLLASPALAQSNMGLTEYPGPTCTKPQKPVQPGASQPGMDEGPSAAAAYNAKVRAFNNAVNAYNQAQTEFNACMKIYIDNGNADMTRIKQRLDAAVMQANLP
jgi:hypothetical protein